VSVIPRAASGAGSWVIVVRAIPMVPTALPVEGAPWQARRDAVIEWAAAIVDAHGVELATADGAASPLEAVQEACALLQALQERAC
jgi:hypothetical protein